MGSQPAQWHQKLARLRTAIDDYNYKIVDVLSACVTNTAAPNRAAVDVKQDPKNTLLPALNAYNTKQRGYLTKTAIDAIFGTIISVLLAAQRTPQVIAMQQLVDLLNARFTAVQQVGELKKQQNANTATVPFYTPEREAYILQALHQYNKTRLHQTSQPTLTNAAIDAIFREIISAALALECTLHIGYLGPDGSFTHLAAQKNFGASAQYCPYDTIEELCILRPSDVDCTVVPIENSTVGMVKETVRALSKSAATQVEICNELYMPIHHSLIASTPIALNKVRVIIAHEQAFKQCQEWLTNTLPNVHQKLVASNSRAVTLLDECANHTAAIAHQSAAYLHKKHVIAANIHDQADNRTRFFVLRAPGQTTSIHPDDKIGKQLTFKTVLLFYCDDVDFAARVAPILQAHNLPPVVYWFSVRPVSCCYVECCSHKDQAPIQQMLDALYALRPAINLKCLGSYPSAVSDL